MILPPCLVVYGQAHTSQVGLVDERSLGYRFGLELTVLVKFSRSPASVARCSLNVRIAPMSRDVNIESRLHARVLGSSILVRTGS